MCSSEVLPVSPPSGMCVSPTSMSSKCWHPGGAIKHAQPQTLCHYYYLLQPSHGFYCSVLMKIGSLLLWLPRSVIWFSYLPKCLLVNPTGDWVACLTDPQYGLLHWDTQKSLKLFAVVQTCRTVFEKMGKQNYPELLNPSSHYMEQVKKSVLLPHL